VAEQISKRRTVVSSLHTKVRNLLTPHPPTDSIVPLTTVCMKQMREDY